MKLSEMTNQQAVKVTIKLIPVIKNIVTDKKILEIWNRKIDIEAGMNEEEMKIKQSLYVSEKLLDLAPYLLENHENDVYKILAILNNKKIEEIKKQLFITTIQQLTELMNDEALIKLFTM